MSDGTKITRNTKLVIPAAVVGAGLVAFVGWMATMQRSIDLTLLELKYCRERVEMHCKDDRITKPADVREAMRK